MSKFRFGLASLICLYGFSNVASAEQHKNIQSNTNNSVANKTVRIINGKDTEQGAYPFMTGLVSYSATSIEPFCGASFIGGRYVLTAAHCLEGDTGEDLAVWIGGHDITQPEGGRKVRAAQVYLHEQYDSFSTNNDVAIIELVEEVEGIEPVNIITPEMEATLEEGFEFTVMGWGNTSTEDVVYLDVLQEVNVPLYNREQCLQDYTAEGSTESDITEQMLCAGFVEGGKDSCQGDSGGPLVFERDGSWYQAGVVSFGNGCAQPNAPGIYSRLSQFNNWIDAKKAGVSYRQSHRNGFVEQVFEEQVNIELANVGQTSYQVTGLDIVNVTNMAPVTIEQNGCDGQQLAFEQRCSVTLAVAADQAGESGFQLNVATDHPQNPEAQIFFSMNTLAAESLEMSELVGSPETIQWWGGGDASWEAQTINVDSGENAIASGDLTDFQQSVLLATIDDNRATSMSFKYLVSSEENYDFLLVVHNNELKLRASGAEVTEYADHTIDLGPGKDRIAIIYAKDQSVSEGDDKAYIDSVSVELGNQLPVAAVSQSEISLTEGDDGTLDASSSSDPDSDSLTYTWVQIGDSATQIELTNVNSAVATFTAPEVSSDTSFTFRVTVTDSLGAQSTAEVTVNVAAQVVALPVPPPATTTPTRSSGGGSMGAFLLLLVSLVSARKFTASK